MNIPMPPTDNLYKFLALSGLIGIFYIFTMLIKSTHKLSSEVADLTADTDKLRVEVDYLESLIKNVNKHGAVADDNIVDEQIFQIKLKRIDLTCRHDKSSSIYKLLKKLTIISSIGLVVFTFMSVFGFIAWYSRVQQPSDKILFEQSQSKPATP